MTRSTMLITLTRTLLAAIALTTWGCTLVVPDSAARDAVPTTQPPRDVLDDQPTPRGWAVAGSREVPLMWLAGCASDEVGERCTHSDVFFQLIRGEPAPLPVLTVRPAVTIAIRFSDAPDEIRLYELPPAGAPLDGPGEPASLRDGRFRAPSRPGFVRYWVVASWSDDRREFSIAVRVV